MRLIRAAAALRDTVVLVALLGAMVVLDRVYDAKTGRLSLWGVR